MTINEILKQSIKELKEAKIEEASLIAKILLTDILKIKKEELVIKSEEEISIQKQEQYLRRNRKDKNRISTSIHNSKKRIHENAIHSK